MDVLVNGLFVIFGVILGWLLQYLFPGRDARRLAEAQERLATIEQARAEWEEKYRRLVGFTPRTQIVGYGPGSQSIMINANEEFEAFQLDYLRLRVRVRVLGAEREVLIPARIENVLVGNAVHRKVIG
jgi:hypothetical protein